jgi:uncharacterized protein (DUF924 family)
MADSTATPAEARDVLTFWFEEMDEEQWYLTEPSDQIDGAIRSRFLELYLKLAEEVPGDWLATSKGTLAAIIVLDQFPRNMFRNDHRAYACDGKALDLAKRAIDQGFDQQVSRSERRFFLVPFQHSESKQDQLRSVELCTALGYDGMVDYAQRHLRVIERFGRFPHRNGILGRAPTTEEEEFLKKPGLFW